MPALSHFTSAKSRGCLVRRSSLEETLLLPQCCHCAARFHFSVPDSLRLASQEGARHLISDSASFRANQPFLLAISRS
jgi:hypothetical protein